RVRLVEAVLHQHDLAVVPEREELVSATCRRPVGGGDVEADGNLRPVADRLEDDEPPAVVVMCREKVHDLSAIPSDRRLSRPAAAGHAEPFRTGGEQLAERLEIAVVERGVGRADRVAFAHVPEAYASPAAGRSARRAGIASARYTRRKPTGTTRNIV